MYGMYILDNISCSLPVVRARRFCFATHGRSLHSVYGTFSLCMRSSRAFFRKTIPPNLHMLEDHAADFIGTWTSPGHGVYGDQGAGSIHKIFRLLQRAYCSMQPATIRLQSKLKKKIIATPRCKGSETCIF